MFEIPLDLIATRTSEELHRATRADDDSQDAAVDAESLTDPDDVLPVEGLPYLPTLATAQ